MHWLRSMEIEVAENFVFLKIADSVHEPKHNFQNCRTDILLMMATLRPSDFSH